MKKFFLKVLTTILMTMISWSTMAQVPAATKVKPKNCHIQVTTLEKTGETRVATRRFFYKSKDQCEKMNRILSDNMNPAEIVSVETKLQWSEK